MFRWLAAIFALMVEMRIEFLGTGTSQGVPVLLCSCAVCTSQDQRDKRLRTSVCVQAGGSTVLIDAGPDLRQQVLRSPPTRLDAVLLTHEHMDHIAGIDELRAFNFAQGGPVDIYANAATLAAVERMFHYAFTEKRYPGVPELRLHRVDGTIFEAAGIKIMPVRALHHTMEVLGFRIGDLAYLTDVKTVEAGELEKLRGLDILVVNALRRKPHHSHFNLEEALAFVEELAPKQAYFTHISHLLGPHADVERELPAGVHLAYDGLVLETR